jgi:hypothetical protein
MSYVSCRYIQITDPMGRTSTDQQVVCTDDEGREWFIPVPHEECQVGDWLRFVEAGGTIEPYSGPETPGTQPA